MAKWIKEVTSSSNKVSSKRVITIVSFLLMATAFIGNLFFDLTVDEFIYDSMSYIVIAGLGFTAAEWFGSGKGKQEEQYPPAYGYGQGGIPPHQPQNEGGFDRGYSKGYQDAMDDYADGSLKRVQDLPNNDAYERGYREGYQAAKENCLSGNSETEADMH